MSLIDFATRFGLEDSGSSEEELRQRWYSAGCPALVAQVEELGYEGQDARRCTFEMLQQSASRLEMARAACETLSHLLLSGIQSIMVAGSVARGEATRKSDIDFNLQVTDEYMQSLYTRKSARAKTPHELLVGLERQLRNRIQADLLRELQVHGYPKSQSKVTMKPFTWGQLGDLQERTLAHVHLLNVVFGATAVYGADEFERRLQGILEDPLAVQGAILARLALLHTRKDLVRAPPPDELPSESAGQRETEDPLKAAHAVACSMSAILSAGLGEGDPQIPYWWTLDSIAGAWLDTYTRSALGTFLAVVTLCHGGIMSADPLELSALLEAALATLPTAIDVIIERLLAEHAREETIETWEAISAYVARPSLALGLARDLGMT